jgi:hypothetical protein
MERQERRRAGKPKNNKQARATPLAGYHGTPGRVGGTRAELVGAVVEMMSVAVAAVAPVMLTGLEEPKLKVGG